MQFGETLLSYLSVPENGVLEILSQKEIYISLCWSKWTYKISSTSGDELTILILIHHIPFHD